jgi:uncharacterized membrane protein
MSDTILITRLTFGVFRTLQAVVMCILTICFIHQFLDDFGLEFTRFLAHFGTKCP